MAAVVEGSSGFSRAPGPMSDPPSCAVSPKDKDSPLPPLPIDVRRERMSRRSLPTPSVSSVAAGKRRAVNIPPEAPREALRRMLTDPRLLARLLSVLSWQSFHALVSTCRTYRATFSSPKLRNAVLSRFVPGYRLCLADREAVEVAVDVSLHDLAIFGELMLHSSHLRAI